MESKSKKNTATKNTTRTAKNCSSKKTESATESSSRSSKNATSKKASRSKN